MWELVSLDLVVISVGSFLGSVKANFNDKEKKSGSIRFINILMGLFCGISVGLHFETELAIYLVGLLSLVSSMLAVSILDTLYSIAPMITKTIVVWKLGIKK